MFTIPAIQQKQQVQDRTVGQSYSQRSTGEDRKYSRGNDGDREGLTSLKGRASALVSPPPPLLATPMQKSSRPVQVRSTEGGRRQNWPRRPRPADRPSSRGGTAGCQRCPPGRGGSLPRSPAGTGWTARTSTHLDCLN